jgi:hypothetical protein
MFRGGVLLIDSKLDLSVLETPHASSLALNDKIAPTMEAGCMPSTEGMISEGFSKFDAGGVASP